MKKILPLLYFITTHSIFLLYLLKYFVIDIHLEEEKAFVSGVCKNFPNVLPIWTSIYVAKDKVEQFLTGDEQFLVPKDKAVLINL